MKVIVPDEPRDPADDWLDYEYMASIDAVEEPLPTIEEVHLALSKIPGNLSDNIRAERDSRG